MKKEHGERMKFGLIGFGAWGEHHAAAITKAEDAELIAIACKSEQTFAKAKKAYPKTRVYRDYNELIQNPDVEALDIVLPTFLHAEVGVKALLAGKHVLLEKPMALTVEECDRLISAAESSGKVLSIGHEFRLSSQWGAIKEIIDRGDIGVPLYVLVTLFRFPYRKGSEDWRWQLDKVGSWILEEPIHFFDFVQWFLAEHGDPRSIIAHGNSKGRAEGLYDNFTSLVKYDGAYAVITQCIAGFEHHQVIEISGTEGAIRTTWSGVMDRTLDPHFHLYVQKKGEAEVRELSIVLPSGEVFELQEELGRIVKHFRAGTPLYPPQEARKLVKICLEAERSLREQKEISLSF